MKRPRVDRSLASWTDLRKLRCFVVADQPSPHEIFLGSNKKFWFQCDVCPHKFESASSDVTNKKRPRWCPYCSGHKLCGVKECRSCHQRSLAGWTDLRKLQCFVVVADQLPMHKIPLASNQKFSFKCDKCPHEFESMLGHVTSEKNPTWCPFCAGNKLCGDIECRTCHKRSLAGWTDLSKLQCFIVVADQLPMHKIPLASNQKFWFQCDKCPHEFESVLCHVTNNLRPTWCPYCAKSNKMLCGVMECQPCHKRSLAGWTDLSKLQCFVVVADQLPMHKIPLASNQKFSFQCDKCPHEFKSVLNDVTRNKNPTWGPYCSGHKLCGIKECQPCHQRSLACWTDIQKLRCFVVANQPSPHEIHLNSHNKFWFQCNVCPHEFKSALSSLTNTKNPCWCPYCFGRVCGKDECQHCERSCSVRSQCDPSRPRKAQVQTRVTRRWVCKPCLEDVVRRDPSETPLQYRAKVSLEIYMLAELQRLSMLATNTDSTNFLWMEPTAWDCAILPGLSYKPDNIWCFDHNGNPFVTAGACKLNLDDIGYVLQLEVLEHGIQEHSDARNVSDAQREEEIRRVFVGVPMGMVYVVVAHTKHEGADPINVFFRKNVELEYEVIPGREDAWQARIEETRTALIAMHVERLDETRWL